MSRIITSGSTGGLQAANFDTQRVLNQINAEVSRQQSSMDSLRQLLQEISGDAGARNNEQAKPIIRNNLSGHEATKADQDGYIWKIETNKPVIWINPQPYN